MMSIILAIKIYLKSGMIVKIVMVVILLSGSQKSYLQLYKILKIPIYFSDNYFVYIIMIHTFSMLRGKEDDNYIHHASFDLLKLYNLIFTSLKITRKLYCYLNNNIIKTLLLPSYLQNVLFYVTWIYEEEEVALGTGSSKGIGRSIALSFARSK